MKAKVLAGIGALCIGFAVNAAEVKEKYGAWEVTEMVNKMDDTKRGIAAAKSLDGRPVYVIVKCDEAGHGVYIQFHGAFQGETRGRTRPFVYRVDKHPKQDAKWEYVKNGAVEFDKAKAQAFARGLVGGERLLIQQYSYEFAVTESEIPITGADKAMKRVFQLCGSEL